MRKMKKIDPRLTLALLLAVTALLDNATTVFAVKNGATELNPIVSFFLSNPALYTLFTVAKTALSFYLPYKYYSRTRSFITIYAITLFFFTRAALINTINAIK